MRTGLCSKGMERCSPDTYIQKTGTSESGFDQWQMAEALKLCHEAPDMSCAGEPLVPRQTGCKLYGAYKQKVPITLAISKAHSENVGFQKKPVT